MRTINVIAVGVILIGSAVLAYGYLWACPIGVICVDYTREYQGGGFAIAAVGFLIVYLGRIQLRASPKIITS